MLRNQSINIVNPNKENVLMVPNHGIKEINTWILLIPIDGGTLVPNNGGKSSFSMKPKHQFIYPNEWNEFVTPNH